MNEISRDKNAKIFAKELISFLGDANEL